jgi:hypothetical protein
VRDKRGFLSAVLCELAGDTHVSFEGDLRGLRILDFPGASSTETTVLKRNTIWPPQDFVVLPLEASSINPILAAICNHVPRRVIHIQIEKSGRLAFGAYDNFDPDCLFLGDAVPSGFLDVLVSRNLLSRRVKRPGL